MSVSKPLEAEYLAPAEKAVNEALSDVSGDQTELRFQLLEACSAHFGGFDLTEYHQTFGISTMLEAKSLIDAAAKIVNAIELSPIHPALALSALSREVLNDHERKSTGAYHTDFRLATRLADLAAPNLLNPSRIIDPACGAGILLAALTVQVCGTDRKKISDWFSQAICAADLSENALRASLLSLASLTDDMEALKTMRKRWFCGDSLLASSQVWKMMAPEGFDAVIGNPPWEKVKISRHEFLQSSGVERHYGDVIGNLDERSYDSKRMEVGSYSKQLLDRYPELGRGDPDLYIAFTDLFYRLCRNGGTVAALVPGGFIRSQGTQAIRENTFSGSERISISIIHNRARFFAIDSRFKFLAVTLIKSKTQKAKLHPINLIHEEGSEFGLLTTGSANIGRKALSSIRRDLTLPEVRSSAEWKVYKKISEIGCSWEDASTEWSPDFCREIDMSKERKNFLCKTYEEKIALVEGRMIQAHRFGAKGHVSGTGRKAKWEIYPVGGSKLAPQFRVDPNILSPALSQRIQRPRIGFCDIAGQTNERSLMAALIPPGVVCGNKVPTVIFPNDPSQERLLVWLAIANSFVFDWMLRRVLTTTVNYFLLKSVPLPNMTPHGLPWQRLATSAAELMSLDESGDTRQTYERIAQLRSEIDAEVAVSYGLGLAEMELILRDFPILDRGQPALSGESKSTITLDLALATVAKRTGESSTTWLNRWKDAQKLGAVPYVTSQLALQSELFTNKELEKHG